MENKSLSIPNSYRFGLIGSPDAFNPDDNIKKDLIKKYEEKKSDSTGKSIQPKNQYEYVEDTFRLHNDFYIIDFDAVNGLSLNDLLTYCQESNKLGYFSNLVSEEGYLFFVMWDELSIPLCHFPYTNQDICHYHIDHNMRTKYRCRYLCLFDVHTIDDLDQTINEFVASQLLKECDHLSATNVRRAEAFIDKYTGNNGPVYTKK